MIWYILISLLAVLLLWLLLGPVILFLDTDRKRYQLVLPGIFKAAVVPAEDLLHIRGRIFFVPYRFNPFRTGKKSRKEKEKKRPAKKKRSLNISRGSKMFRSAVRAFRIRKLRLDIDTDDFLLNAWLIPAFSMVNSGNIRMSANFNGDFSLLLDVRTRICVLLWIVIKYRIKSIL
ncbi:MAG: hypothetical protein R6U78_17895 [Bacteroidales bacterium]